MRYTKTIILAIILFILRGIDFVGLDLNQALISYPLIFLSQALIDATLVSIAIGRSRQSGWKLIAAVFLVYYAVSSFLVGLEGYYLSDLLTPAIAARIFINGAFVAAAFSSLAVAIHGKMKRVRSHAAIPLNQRRAWWSWLWRTPLAGFTYLLLFFFSGLLVFQPLVRAFEPLAGPAYIAAFQPENPGGILIFQWLRGMLWAAVTLPLLFIFKGPRWKTGLLVSLIYALGMAPLNLVPSEMADGIRVAHTLEIFMGNFIFGWIVVLLMGVPARRAEEHLSP